MKPRVFMVVQPVKHVNSDSGELGESEDNPDEKWKCWVDCMVLCHDNIGGVGCKDHCAENCNYSPPSNGLGGSNLVGESCWQKCIDEHPMSGQFCDMYCEHQ